MQEALIQALRSRRGEISARWRTLLRPSAVTSRAPLDAMTTTPLVDSSIDAVLHHLTHGAEPRPFKSPARSSAGNAHAACRCGKNPLLAHFIAGEKALIETLIVAQNKISDRDCPHRATALTELYLAVRAVAKREVDSVCAQCPPGGLTARTAGLPTNFAESSEAFSGNVIR